MVSRIHIGAREGLYVKALGYWLSAFGQTRSFVAQISIASIFVNLKSLP
jgi:hypothetical protein